MTESAEEGKSLAKRSQLPDKFWEVLIIFTFIIALAPLLSGMDFGVLKIPAFSPYWNAILFPIGFCLFLLTACSFYSFKRWWWVMLCLLTIIIPCGLWYRWIVPSVSIASPTGKEVLEVSVENGTAEIKVQGTSSNLANNNFKVILFTRNINKEPIWWYDKEANVSAINGKWETTAIAGANAEGWKITNEETTIEMIAVALTEEELKAEQEKNVDKGKFIKSPEKFPLRSSIQTIKIKAKAENNLREVRKNSSLYCPNGNGLFVLYYGGSVSDLEKIWQLQPNFVVVADLFYNNPDIPKIFHKTNKNNKKVRALAYVPLNYGKEEKLKASEIDERIKKANEVGYDGFFFDETDSTKYDWNKERVKLAKSSNEKLIIMNPGQTPVNGSIFDYADIVSVENYFDKPPTTEPKATSIIESWRWLAIQGDPAKKAANSSQDAFNRLTKFRKNGGFWYYSPAYSSIESATHIHLPDWLNDFATKVKENNQVVCSK